MNKVVIKILQRSIVTQTMLVAISYRVCMDVG